jgi:hypothetical protein
MHDNAQVEDLSFSALRYADGPYAMVTARSSITRKKQGIVLQCERAKWKRRGIAMRPPTSNGSPCGPRRGKQLHDAYERLNR